MENSRISDFYWYQIAKLIPKPKKRADGPGRPVCDFRLIFDAILWVLRSGRPWRELPGQFPSFQTCHRRFQQWSACGLFRALLAQLLRGKEIDLTEAYIDGSFVPAKEGGDLVGSSLKGKGSKFGLILDRKEHPLAIELTSANRHDVTLVHPLLAHRLLPKLPSRLLGDKGFDSDPLDKDLARKHIELIAPDRDCKLTKTQDKRKLRRMKRRWTIERYFSWLKAYRRIATRWERKASNYLAMLHLGCICLELTRF